WIVAAPLDGQHRYKWSYRWRYDQPQALALVEHGLQENGAVYALFVSRQEMEEKMVRLPHIDGYEWVLAEDPTAEAAILKLSPGSSGVGCSVKSVASPDSRWRNGEAMLD